MGVPTTGITPEASVQESTVLRTGGTVLNPQVSGRGPELEEDKHFHKLCAQEFKNEKMYLDLLHSHETLHTFSRAF